MKHRMVLIIALTLILMGLALIISPGCTSTLKALTGTYSHYEVTDGKVTYFRWNPMSMRYHTRVLEEADKEAEGFSDISDTYPFKRIDKKDLPEIIKNILEEE